MIIGGTNPSQSHEDRRHGPHPQQVMSQLSLSEEQVDRHGTIIASRFDGIIDTGDEIKDETRDSKSWHAYQMVSWTDDGPAGESSLIEPWSSRCPGHLYSPPDGLVDPGRDPGWRLLVASSNPWHESSTASQQPNREP